MQSTELARNRLNYRDVLDECSIRCRLFLATPSDLLEVPGLLLVTPNVPSWLGTPLLRKRENRSYPLPDKHDLCSGLQSGMKKEREPKLFGPDIFQWGGGLPREGVGAKKFEMSLGGSQKVRDVPRNQGNLSFWAGYPRILPGYFGGCPKSLRKKVCVQFLAPMQME